MTRIVRTEDVAEADVAGILCARTGLVEEAGPDGRGAFSSRRGPVGRYSRVVEVEPPSDGVARVTQTVDYELAVPFLGWLVALPTRRELGRVAPESRPPWWGPPAVLDADAWQEVGALLTLSVVLGYLGTLLTQTVTYSAQEFHAGTAAEGVALAVVRGDVIISLGLVALADRKGRRLIALGGGAMGCALSALGAVAPSLAWLAASQVLARGFVTAATISSSVLIAEAMPKGARAWAMGVVAMAAAVGAGVCVFALPIAGLGIRAWRLLYAGSLLWLGLVLVVGRRLQESKRYTLSRNAPPDLGHAGGGGGLGGAGAARRAIGRSRLLLLSAAYFCLMMFVTPASEFQNEYLRRERHFSPTRIAIFTVLTVLPGAIGIVVGGRLADTRGRRRVGIVAVTGVSLFGVIAFSINGWSMWVAATIAAVTGAAVTPAITVYGPELFGTDRRGIANGVLTAAGRVGAVIGLLGVGVLEERLGSFGPAFAIVAVGPAALVLLIIFAFPETANRSLEDLNPGDAPIIGPLERDG